MCSWYSGRALLQRADAHLQPHADEKATIILTHAAFTHSATGLKLRDEFEAIVKDSHKHGQLGCGFWTTHPFSLSSSLIFPPFILHFLLSIATTRPASPERSTGPSLADKVFSCRSPQASRLHESVQQQRVWNGATLTFSRGDPPQVPSPGFYLQGSHRNDAPRLLYKSGSLVIFSARLSLQQHRCNRRHVQFNSGTSRQRQVVIKMPDSAMDFDDLNNSTVQRKSSLQPILQAPPND
ncbi:hypothetical protein Q8A67_018242 [Cirrhinus molitorella]|uniref:Uncharacterized protein n=1 Tax=Cirrhinus molitorella TaxID=172907 RepID=A0AA88PH96_9TELE|nr:hypothetical protein Q8A67_018242 [Cirrhinus molitorella]